MSLLSGQCAEYCKSLSAAIMDGHSEKKVTGAERTGN